MTYHDDYSWRYPDRQVLIDFGDPASYTLAGATPTLDDEHLLTGLAGKTRQQGVGFNVATKSFTAPLDLTGRGLLLVAKWFGADQIQYLVSSLGAPVTFDGTPQDVVLATDPGFAAVGSMSLGDGAGIVFWQSRQGLTLKNCVLATGYDSTAKTVKTATGFFPAGTRATHWGNDAHATPISFTLRLAESASAYAAGNYVQFKLPARHWYGWLLSTFLPGPFGQAFGAGCDISSVGYARIAPTLTSIPFAGAAYNGRQLQPVVQASVKWEALLSFEHVPRPFFSPTFDDANDSDWQIVIPAFERPRAGFPGGMRATFHVIDSNIVSSDSLAAYQRASINGHEISMHAHWQAAHADQNDVITSEIPKLAGVGTPIHYELQMPGGGVADVQVQHQWLKDRVGLPGGPLTWAWPHGNSPGPVIDAAIKDLGLVAQRSLSGGIWNTFPAGDLHRVAGDGTNRDIVAGDMQGHHLMMDILRTVCLTGTGYTSVTHAVTPGSATPSGAGGWNEQQLNEFLDYASDVKTGTNAHGNNGELLHAPDLQVGTLTEQLTGYPARRSPGALAGAGI